METTESPRRERYLISALVETAETLNHLNESLKAAEATVVKSEALGLRKLAFPISKKTELELISAFFEADPGVVKALEKTFQGDNLIKRFLLTKWAVDPNAEPRRGKKKEKAGATA